MTFLRRVTYCAYKSTALQIARCAVDYVLSISLCVKSERISNKNYEQLLEDTFVVR